MSSLKIARNQPMADQVLRDGKMVADQWLYLTDEDPLPPGSNPVALPVSRWLADREACLAYPGAKGIVLTNTQDVQLLSDDLQHLDLICIDFPIAVDGRGYSQARLLRQRYGYDKELRAVGEVMVDQLFLMARCGINAFSLQPGEDVIQASRYLQPFSFTYQ
jgi:uncharacterized protein (DUF934 family)